MPDNSKRQQPMPSAVSTDFHNADLLQRLTDGRASFLLVGGAAVAFYGCRDDRHLRELDILIDPTIENAKRVMAVLSAAKVQLWIRDEDLAGPKKQLPVKQLLFDIDILTPAEDESFSAMLARSVEGTVNGNTVRVIGREDLIAMKFVAARNADTGTEKHQLDLDCLVRQIRAELSDWLSTKEFVKTVEALDQILKSREHFVSTDFKFLRDDAWTLANFARLIKADRVRLSNEAVGERFPDGFVEVACKHLAIEITEADRWRRRRGNEYKDSVSPVTCEQINSADEVAAALIHSIEKKLNKFYSSPPPTLVINLNLGVHGRPEQETQLGTVIAEIKERYASKFSEIYVLRNDKLL
jgi:hypothetical protein